MVTDYDVMGAYFTDRNGFALVSQSESTQLRIVCESLDADKIGCLNLGYDLLAW
jgi:hypothetical protein